MNCASFVELILNAPRFTIVTIVKRSYAWKPRRLIFAREVSDAVRRKNSVCSKCQGSLLYESLQFKVQLTNGNADTVHAHMTRQLRHRDSRSGCNAHLQYT